jgi:hypothetical protein
MYNLDIAGSLPRHPLWDALMTDHFRKTPLLLRDALSAPLLDERELLATYQRAADPTKDNKNVIFYGAAEDGRFSNVAGVKAIQFLPRQSDSSFQVYQGRLRAAGVASFSAHLRYCMMEYSDASFRTARALLSPVFSRTGYPPGSWNLDCYAGRYRETVFGVHRDGEDQFYMTPIGQKRLLLWSPQEWTSVPDYNQYRYCWQNHPVPPRVYEVGPRDVLYWPAEWYHIGESPSFALSVQVNMRYLPIVPDYRKLLPDLESRIRALMAEDAQSQPAAGELYNAGSLFADVGPALEDFLLQERLRWRSVGYASRHDSADRVVPQTLPFSSMAVSSRPFSLSRECPLHWGRLNSGDVVIACNGATIFGHLEVVMLSVLLLLTPGSTWTLQTLQKRAPERSDAVARLITWLNTHGGLEEVSAAQESPRNDTDAH